jgi:hypothetical protein
MLCLDTNLNISFISEDGVKATFYPMNALEFIDYLSEINIEILPHILSENFEVSNEIIEILQEAILSYLEESEIPASALKYYKDLYTFLETAAIVEFNFIIEEGEEEDVEINEFIYNILEELSWDFNISINNTVKDLIQESSYKRVVRGGKLIKQKVCPPGYKLAGGKCIRMSTTEVRFRMKAALKAAKTRRKHERNSLFKQMLMKRRAKSMKVRDMRGI